MKTLTRDKISIVTIISSDGMIEKIDENIVKSVTFFELKIDVSSNHLYDIEEEEEFEW